MMATKPVFLISSGRCGTHLLRGLLCSGFSATDAGEVFNPDGGSRVPDYFGYLVDRSRRQPSLIVPRQDTVDDLFSGYVSGLCDRTETAVLIVDVKYNQTHLLNPLWHIHGAAPHLLDMIKSRGWRLIHMIRRNVLAARASYELAKVSGKWVSHNQDEVVGENVKVRIDASTLRETLATDVMRIRFFDNCLAGYPHAFTVVYEDVLKRGVMNPDLANRLAEFLEQPEPPPLAPATLKTSPSLRDFIENFDEVASRLSGTPFAEMVLA